jgi:hypothetical protein
LLKTSSCQLELALKLLEQTMATAGLHVLDSFITNIPLFIPHSIFALPSEVTVSFTRLIIKQFVNNMKLEKTTHLGASLPVLLINRQIKKMRWAVHVARMGEGRVARSLGDVPNKRDHWKDLGLDGNIPL